MNENKKGVKVVFLDVDGVLNSNRTKERCGPFIGIAQDSLLALKKIVDETKAIIVLVSSWKEAWFKEKELKKYQDDLADYLDKRLAEVGLEIHDKTTVEPLPRGEGILLYLEDSKKDGIEVGNFVILDDFPFDYKKTKLTRYWVQTDFERGGLTEEHAKKAIELLTSKRLTDG